MRALYWSSALFFVLTCACSLGRRDSDREQMAPGVAPAAPASKNAQLSGTLMVSSVTSTSSGTGAAFTPDVDTEALLQPVRTSRELKKVFGEEGSPKPAREPDYIAGDIALRVEQALSPEALLRTTRTDGYRCEHRAYASAYLHLVRCTSTEGEKLSAAQTRALAERFARIEGVRYAEVDRRAQPFAVPNDPYYKHQWHYPLMNLPAAWDVTGGSPGVVVAVIDTGMRWHPDLDPKLVASVDMISDPVVAGDGDGRDLDGSDVAGLGPNGTSCFHGTHVAGTVAAANDAQGGVGVAPFASLVNVRALSESGGSGFDIAAGIFWAAGGQVPGMPFNPSPAKVINLSLGGYGPPSELYQEVIDAAVGAGAVVIVAAGNDDDDAGNYHPANQQNVICVGATGANGKITGYSNFGATVDVMAPGGDLTVDRDGDGYADGVLSTYSDAATGKATYQFLQGTSMAAPHVAGLVALMASVNPSITAAQAEALLKSTANGAFKCNVGCGAGLVDAYAAIAAAKGNTSGSGPAKLAAPQGTFVVQREDVTPLTVSNLGGQPLTVSAKASGALGPRIEWVKGSSLSVPAGKSGMFEVYVDATGLPEGRHHGAIELTSNGGNDYILVELNVTSQKAERVAIVAAVFQDSAGEWKLGGATKSDPSNGQAWTLELPAGTYFLIAGVDSDADGKLFEDGEPVGFYKSMEDPIAVSVVAGQSLSALSFSVLPRSSVSDPAPGAAIGEACATDEACASGLCATDWKGGGYCTQGCGGTACPGSSSCVAFESGDFCMANCAAPGGQSTCRAGYTCTKLTNGQGVCL